MTDDGPIGPTAPPGLDRPASVRAALATRGFADPLLAGDRLARLGLEPDGRVVAALAASGDPDLALDALSRLSGRVADADRLREALADPTRRLLARLAAVLGASRALGDQLERRPEDWHVLAEPGDLGVPGDPTEQLLAAVRDRRGREGVDALRVAYRRRLLAVAARDLADGFPVGRTAAALADLAGATLQAAHALACADHPADAAAARLAVLAMGKCGGRELNYVSDVDVVFVAEPEPGVDEQAGLRAAATLATRLMAVCSGPAGEPPIWEVDAALRPEGKAGPLVRTLASHAAYYRRWARTWEFQALLKARPVAGDPALGERYVAEIAPLVWRAAEREHFVTDVQAMRRRVEEHIPSGQADRELKLGRGGLRDVEFAVQLLQLVHGRADESLRSPNTLDALAALAAGGYVARVDAAELAQAYRFLRLLEHLLQLQRLRRTHLLPAAGAELRWLARSAGFGERGLDPVEELLAERARSVREVRRLHEKLFYRPLLGAVARLPAEEARLSPAGARDRLEALGFAEPAAALRHIETLTTGVSRRAAIQRTLLPVMLGWFADAPDPDAGLLAFRQVSDALGTTPWYLRFLRDEGSSAQRLAQLLASSRYVADLLTRAPEAMRLLARDEDLQPLPYELLAGEMAATADRSADPEAAVAAVRSIRRRELLRIAAADLLGLLPTHAVGEALTDVTVTVLGAALDVALRAVAARRGVAVEAFPARLAVIAMGRLGGAEQGYGSDADVIFVHEPLAGVEPDVAADAALEVVGLARSLLAEPAADPPLEVDADLRPEGRQGALTRSLGSYAQYYQRRSVVWEAQALLRAVPIAGDPALGRDFLALVDPLRWPSGGLSEAELREVRRIKARVEAERLPRGADPTLHTKLGRGGLADVEWTVQLIQMQHAGTVPGLRTTHTCQALAAAVEAGLLAPADGRTLADAWRMATRVRNAITLVRGRAGDQLPPAGRERARVARALGYPPGGGEELAEDYRRATRRARTVVERVFYGE